MLLLGFLYAVLPTAAAGLRPGACRQWQERSVHVEALPATELVRLRRETTVVKVPSYVAAWPRDGISLPGIVAISDRRALSSQDSLLWHEMVHQYQYRRDGSLVFVARYVADWHRGLLRGCGLDAAYEAIGYEIETDVMLRRMRLSLGGVHSEEFERVAALIDDPTQVPPPAGPKFYKRDLTPRPAPPGQVLRPPSDSIQ